MYDSIGVLGYSMASCGSLKHFYKVLCFIKGSEMSGSAIVTNKL